LGDICENLATKYLSKQSYKILDRNYRKKWGEIDIVAKENVSRPHILHFIEVKGMILRKNYVFQYNPEDNIHIWKQKRLWRAIQSWLLEHKVSESIEWQVDVMAIFLDPVNKEAKIRWTKNIILEA